MSDTPAKPPAKRRRKPAAKKAIAKPIAAAASNELTVAEAAQPRLLYSFDIPVRWRDLDAFNHVNNSTFLTYLEEARLAWLDSLPGPWLSEHSAPVLAAATLNYRRPIGWPETLRIRLYCERLGRSSMSLVHRISSATDEDVLYSDGSVVMVWVDGRSGRAADLPDVVRAAGS